jgi:hypothetical protein
MFEIRVHRVVSQIQPTILLKLGAVRLSREVKNMQL